jgi:hypothetical protein
MYLSTLSPSVLIGCSRGGRRRQASFAPLANLLQMIEPLFQAAKRFGCAGAVDRRVGLAALGDTTERGAPDPAICTGTLDARTPAQLASGGSLLSLDNSRN